MRKGVEPNSSTGKLVADINSGFSSHVSPIKSVESKLAFSDETIFQGSSSPSSTFLKQSLRTPLGSSPVELIGIARSAEQHVCRYVKLTTQEILKAQVFVEKGRLGHKINGRFLPLQGSHLYVLLPNRRLIAYPDNVLEHGFFRYQHSIIKLLALRLAKNEIKHLAFAQGAQVICAGHLDTDQGVLLSVNNFSGHYKPKRRHLNNLKKILERFFHLDLSNVSFQYFNKTKFQDPVLQSLTLPEAKFPERIYCDDQGEELIFPLDL